MAEYPPLIDLTLEQRNRLVDHVRTLIQNHESERQAFINDLTQWQKEYWAKPIKEKNTFPFKGAANIIIPLTAIVYETVHARTMTTAFGPEQKISTKLINPAFSDYVTPIEDFAEYELLRAKFKERIEPAISEIEKYGTGVAKCRYETVVKNGVFYEAGVPQQFPVTVRRGTVIDAVPLSKWYFPFDVSHQDDAYFMGEEFTKPISTIREMEESNFFYKGVYQACKFITNNITNTFETSQQNLENRRPIEFNNLTFVELWFCFDLLKPGEYVEVVAHYSMQANLLLACRYNWRKDLSKPHRVGKYIPVEHRITGVGIAKQNEAFQREITTMHRQRLDNGTIANMQMFIVSRMTGIQPGEPIYPGKVWFVDDPNQVQALKFGEINSSAFNNEHMTLMYSQQRTGVNEVTLGMPQVGTPGTATDTLSRVQEGNKKFDYCYGNIKSFLDDIITEFLVTTQQFGPRTIQYYTNAENGQLVEQFLTLPENLIREGLVIELKSAGQNDNKILDRNNWQQIAAHIKIYYESLAQAAIGLNAPELLQMITMRGFSAATEAMKQMLHTFDIKNIDRIIIPEFLNSVGQRAAPLIGLGGTSNVSNINGNIGSQNPQSSRALASGSSVSQGY